MELDNKESFIKSKDPDEILYKSIIIKDFDYELNEKKEGNEFFKTPPDNFPDEFVDKFYKCENVMCFKRNLIKSLISKKKTRLINSDFDLDLTYMTKRVMAMGYPATFCESIYRNSLKDVNRLFKSYHNCKIKVYNLCLESDRIYDKNIFAGMKVGLFPTFDHSACPIKILLSFCVDLCLYLISDSQNAAALHCKAGKGRTGVMVCAYLVFANLSEDVSKALDEYGYRRSRVGKGVTIQSQRRYLYHFETFLNCNFVRPFYKLIPKICKMHISHSTNLIGNFFQDKSFHEFVNTFKIKKFRIGPFTDKNHLNFKIINFKKHVIFDSSDKFEKTNFKYNIKNEFDDLTDKTYYYGIVVN